MDNPVVTAYAQAKNAEETSPYETQDDILRTEEIVVEEMAIDGICGVY